MRTIFTIITAISALICFAFIGVALVTLAGPKVIGLGHNDQNTYQLKFDGLEMDYDGRVTTIGGGGAKSNTTTTLGVDVIHQHRDVDADAHLPAGDGLVVSIPSFYPIALFAILPIIWVVATIGGKKKKSAPTGSETQPAA
jgi:hypothetical protein